MDTKKPARFGKQVSLQLKKLSMAVLGAAMLFGSLGAVADDIRVGGFWINDVEILGVEGEVIFYLSPAGAEVTQAMDQVQGIRLEALPGYAQGIEQLEAGEASQAVTTLQNALGQARVDWQRVLVLDQLLNAAEAAGDGEAAVRAYVQLVQLNANAFFSDNPPVDLLASLPQDQRQTLVEVLRPAVTRVTRDVRPQIEVLLEIAQEETEGQPQASQGEAATPAQTRQATRTTPATTARTTPSATAAWQDVLPDRLRLTNVVELMRADNFGQARQTVESALSNPNDLAEKLYLLGMIQRVEADRADDPEMYKDAAISFMRVIIHFPPGNRLRVPALVENAYCHYKFGRADRALEILNSQVRNLISEEDYPQYYPRYEEVRELVESGG